MQVMKLIKKKTKKKIIFTVLLFALSPILLIYFIILTIFGLVFSPFEYLIYKYFKYKNNICLGKYYPLILKFEKIVIKSINKLNEKDIKFEFDNTNKVIYLKDNVIIFNITNKTLYNKYKFEPKVIIIKKKKDLSKIDNFII